MAAGGIGQTGDLVLGHVALVSPCKQENAIIQLQFTVDLSARGKEDDTKHAVLTHALTRTQLIERSNAQKRTASLLEGDISRGFRILTLTTHASFTAQISTIR